MLQKLKGTALKIVIVLVIGVLFVGASMLYSVKLGSDIAALKEDNFALQAHLDLLTLKTSTKNQLLQEFEQIREESELFDKKFPKTIIQEDTIHKIRDFETESGCVVRRMSYQMLQADVTTIASGMPDNVHASPTEEVTDQGDLTDEKFQDMYEDEYAEVIPRFGGIKMPVEIMFESSFNEMKAFLTLVANSEQKMGMHEIRLSMKEKTSGTVQIEFYGYIPIEE